MMKRSTLGGGALLACALLFIGLTIVFASVLRGWRVDLTQNGLYTTAPGTRNILKNLKEPVNLYFFFTEKSANEFPQIKTYGTRVREFLQELAARSNGKLRLSIIDPQPYSEDEDRASELGVRGAPTNGGAQLYFGLAGTNSTDGHAAIEFFDPSKEEFLEYDVVKLIYQLANPDEADHRLAVDPADAAELRSAVGAAARAERAVHAGRAAVHREADRAECDVDRCGRERARHRASEGARAGDAVRDRPVRAARRARDRVRRSARGIRPGRRRSAESHGGDDGEQVLRDGDPAQGLGRRFQSA